MEPPGRFFTRVFFPGYHVDRAVSVPRPFTGGGGVVVPRTAPPAMGTARPRRRRRTQGRRRTVTPRDTRLAVNPSTCPAAAPALTDAGETLALLHAAPVVEAAARVALGLESRR